MDTLADSLIASAPNGSGCYLCREKLKASVAGPLMCGGITVFAPLVLNDIKPTDRVGIVGIGGLGHLAIKFAKAWGCEVYAFTHSESKHEEAKRFGADHVVSSIDGNAINAIAGKLDMLLVTVNVPLVLVKVHCYIGTKWTLAYCRCRVRANPNLQPLTLS